MGLITILVILAVLYGRKDFFFGGNPLVTGIAIGIVLVVLWGVKDTGFMGEVLKVIVSLRFLIWVIAVIAGIYRGGLVSGLWKGYIISVIPQAEPFLISAAIIMFVFGTVLVLFPEFYIKKSMKSEGFTLNKNVPATKRIFIQIIGLIIIFACSGLFSEVQSFIYKLFS